MESGNQLIQPLKFCLVSNCLYCVSLL